LPIPNNTRYHLLVAIFGLIQKDKQLCNRVVVGTSGVMEGQLNNNDDDIVMRVETTPLNNRAFMVEPLKKPPRVKWNPTTPFPINLLNMLLPIPPISPAKYKQLQAFYVYKDHKAYLLKKGGRGEIFAISILTCESFVQGDMFTSFFFTKLLNKSI
jgi:hypothetical protein